MLDLNKIAGQIPGISQHLTLEALASRQRLEKTIDLLQQANKRQTDLVELRQTWNDRLIFSSAIPCEPLDTAIPILTPAFNHTVFATDGSQIAPSHHEIAYCYLINIGRVMLHYGQGLHPLLDSIPEVYYKPEDLYVSKQWGIRTEEWIGHKRTATEVEILAEMACRWVKPPGCHDDIPNLALVDGSLIFWFLEQLPHEARDKILPPIFAAWEQLRETKIPLMGYLSASRSGEAINFLRLQACTYDFPHCIMNCGHLGEERAPCQIADPLRDATLWQCILKPGERGALWRSTSRILDLYDEADRIYFCYLNVGTEIARIEFPAWVVDDRELFDRSLSIVLAQVQKGYGYPVAIAEAHNLAVIRGGDRARFFTLLEQQMIRAGIRNVGTSYKETRKRGSIA